MTVQNYTKKKLKKYNLKNQIKRTKGGSLVKKNLLSKKEKEIFMQDALDKMKEVQEEFIEEYGLGMENNKYIMFPDRNRFYMYNDKTKKVFLEARFQVIGSYVEKSKTWRWGWSNRYVPNELKKSALKIMEFGKIAGIDMFSKPKIKDDNLGLLFTAVGMLLSRGKGYYVIPAGYNYPEVFIIFTKVEKINKPYSEIMKNDKNSKNKITKKYTKLIEKSKKLKISKDTKLKGKDTKSKGKDKSKKDKKL